MTLMLARSFAFVANALVAALVLSAALPGPHRILMPEAWGLSEVAPRVWTDAPTRADDLLALAGTARTRVAEFFGDTPPRPTLVLCSSARCARDFGIGGAGLSMADMAVLVSPAGLNQGTLTHEMTHSRLHRSMGPASILNQPYPTWFDEGLATHVAGHPAWRGTVTRAARDRVRRVEHFWQWDDAYRALGAGLAYSAAAAEVADIERRAGQKGLIELIDRAEAGEDFGRVLEGISGR